jgi:ATP-binding cassette, subfamily B, bacterial HlyB/CyaB
MIRLSGIDIRHIDLAYFRSSIGAVLRGNFLFRGTVRDNIAAARPHVSFAEVVEAARMAVPKNLPITKIVPDVCRREWWQFSQGPTARIAIARALLTRRRLLISNEATSALDPESETIVQMTSAK